MIERIHFRILCEIEKQGSLTAAAKKLNLTQSALSHTMKKLEAIKGIELWVKEGRSIRLTEAGNYLLQQANRILPQLERIDEVLAQYAKKERGSLHIGMECHPCYQWLLRVVNPFLEAFAGIDVDVKQRFQFGGMAALFNHDIDILITPDPIHKEGIVFEQVFPYEQVLLVSTDNPIAEYDSIAAQQLSNQTLLTYPVEITRLDVFQQFLLPAQCRPGKHKTLEATEIMLQMVATNRGVATLPDWLAAEHAKTLPIRSVRLGEEGIHKHIHVGYREEDAQDKHVREFIALANNAPASLVNVV